MRCRAGTGVGGRRRAPPAQFAAPRASGRAITKVTPKPSATPVHLGLRREGIHSWPRATSWRRAGLPAGSAGADGSSTPPASARTTTTTLASERTPDVCSTSPELFSRLLAHHDVRLQRAGRSDGLDLEGLATASLPPGRGRGSGLGKEGPWSDEGEGQGTHVA